MTRGSKTTAEVDHTFAFPARKEIYCSENYFDRFLFDISLKTGQTFELLLKLTPAKWRLYDSFAVIKSRKSEPGEFPIPIGASSRDIRESKAINL